MEEATELAASAMTNLAAGTLDLSQAILSYDRESDTLMVHFTGRGEAGISIVVDDHLLIRMDSERQRVLGLQIEGFLIHVAQEQPKLLDALDVAELRGITLEEIAQVRRTLANDRRRRETVGEVISHFTHSDHAAD